MSQTKIRLTFKQQVFEFLNQHSELQHEKPSTIIQQFKITYPDVKVATSSLYQIIKNFKNVGA